MTIDMIDCINHQDGKCKVGNIDVHPEMCRRCILSSGDGPRDRLNINRHLGSVVLQGYQDGYHDDRDAAERAVRAIVRGQVEDAGLDFMEWLRTNALPPVDPPKVQGLRCRHLGKRIKGSSCGCWTKNTFLCNSQRQLPVIPNVDCPCNLYEPVKP